MDLSQINMYIFENKYPIVFSYENKFSSELDQEAIYDLLKDFVNVLVN